MGLNCLFGHKWNGCKCSKCGKLRDEQHDWDLCKGQCKRCIKTQAAQHDWNGCNCSGCGVQRHEWVDGKCSRCGKSLVCEKCGINKANLDNENKDKEAQYAKMRGQVIWQRKGLLLCKNCNGITCSDCSKDTPGYYYKVCPLCGKEHKQGSIIQ